MYSRVCVCVCVCVWQLLYRSTDLKETRKQLLKYNGNVYETPKVWQSPVWSVPRLRGANCNRHDGGIIILSIQCLHVHKGTANLECIITPRACAKGKVIGRVVIVVVVVVVVVSTTIAKSQKIGIWQSALCHQTVENHEKLSSVRFKSLRKAHEHYKSYVFTGHAYPPHLPMPCDVSIAHARSQNR